MSTSRTACNRQRIVAFATSELLESELHELQEHLNVCEQCQIWFDEELSQFAAYDSAATLLTDGANSTASQSLAARPAVDVDGMKALARRLFPANNAELLGQLGQFDLVEALGSGGMGLVFKAFDRELHRYVAIKILSPALSISGAAKQRFIREAQAAAGINSPHIVPIHAVAEAHDIPYLVMNYVPGVNLQEHILRRGPLPLVDALQIARQVALGLRAAHEREIVHRDVKPANILIEPTVLRATLTDFGLARVADDASLTYSGMMAGTPNYMSPEQAAGQTADARSDWYSWGCVLYAMLTGHPPFRGPHAYAVLQQLAQEIPKPVSESRNETPAWLDRFVARLLVKDPGQRLGDGERIVQLLDSCILHLEQPTAHRVPRELSDRSPPTVRRFTWLVAGSLVAATLVGADLWIGPFGDRLKVERQRVGVGGSANDGNAVRNPAQTAVPNVAQSAKADPQIAANSVRGSVDIPPTTGDESRGVNKRGVTRPPAPIAELPSLVWPDEWGVDKAVRDLQRRFDTVESRP